MRLWSLHPKYLDRQGLVALWREGLLAQAVLSGKTQGYKHHPQLIRFRTTSKPRVHIAAYLREVQAEGARRGYRFDADKIRSGGKISPITVTTGQLRFEWQHLKHKLRRRAPKQLASLRDITLPEPHPIFRIVDGGRADWERGPNYRP